MANKQTQRELKEPDALQRAGGGARDWVQERTGLVVGVAVAAVLIGAIAGIVSWRSDVAEEEASRSLGEALALLERPIDPTTPEGSTDTFRDEASQREALLAALTGVREEHGGTRAAATAAFGIANLELRGDDPDAAVEAFEQFLKDAPSEWTLRAAALEGKGYAHESAGRLDEALASFEDLGGLSEAEAKGFLAGHGDYHRGRILQKLGREKEARDAFAQVVDAHVGKPIAQQAEERLQQLGGAPDATGASGTDAVAEDPASEAGESP